MGNLSAGTSERFVGRRSKVQEAETIKSKDLLYDFLCPLTAVNVLKKISLNQRCFFLTIFEDKKDVGVM